MRHASLLALRSSSRLHSHRPCCMQLRPCSPAELPLTDGNHPSASLPLPPTHGYHPLHRHRLSYITHTSPDPQSTSQFTASALNKLSSSSSSSSSSAPKVLLTLSLLLPPHPPPPLPIAACGTRDRARDSSLRFSVIYARLCVHQAAGVYSI